MIDCLELPARWLVPLVFGLVCLPLPLSGQTKTPAKDINQWIELAEPVVAQIEDPAKARVIRGRIIGVQYRLGDTDNALAQWNELLEEASEVTTEGDYGERYTQRIMAGNHIQRLANDQATVGNEDLAMVAFNHLDIGFNRRGLYTSLIWIAGNKDDPGFAKRLFDQGIADDSLKSTEQDLGSAVVSMCDAYLRAQIECGDATGALATLKFKEQQEKGPRATPMMFSHDRQKLSVAEALEQTGELETATQLAAEVVKTVDEKPKGLHYQLEYVTAPHMYWARLHPELLDPEIEKCVRLLESHVGVNGPASGYYRLAHELARLGEFEKAIEFTEKLDQEEHRDNCLKLIAELQAAAGDFMDASQTIDSMKTKRIEVATLIKLAEALINAEEESMARQLIDDALPEVDCVERNDSYVGRDYEFHSRIAALQCRLGDELQALKWIKQLNDPFEKAAAMVAIAEEKLARPNRK